MFHRKPSGLLLASNIPQLIFRPDWMHDFPVSGSLANGRESRDSLGLRSRQACRMHAEDNVDKYCAQFNSCISHVTLIPKQCSLQILLDTVPLIRA